MKKVICFLAAAVLASAGQAAAQHVVEKEVTLLETAEMKRIYGKGDFLLVNTLSPIEFKEKRIAGSINIPLSHYAQGRVSLPDDKEKRLVFYCLGAK